MPDAQVKYRFQNFYLNETVSWVNGEHQFLPFGFSGISIDRNGTNVTSSLVFPNTELTRVWAVKAIEEFWLAQIRVVRVDPDDSSVAASNPDTYRLYSYVGQVTAGSWDDTKAVLTLSSVLDAVGSNVPNRRLNRNLCGHLPSTNRLSL